MNRVGVILLTLSFLFSCNLAKRQLQNEHQLVKNSVKIVEGNRSRFVKGVLEESIRQKPNKKFLGIARLNVWFYRLGIPGVGLPGKNDNWLKRFFRYDIGVNPVILDTLLIEKSMKSMKNALSARGYFYPKIEYKVKPNKLFGFIRQKQRQIVNYNVKLNQPYDIYRIDLNISDKHIHKIVNIHMDESYLRLGNEFSKENLLKEQNRIVDLLRNHGYFQFSKDFLDFDFDSSEGNYKVTLGINIQNKTDFEPHDIYKINDIIVEIEQNEGLDLLDQRDTIRLKNFTYIPRNNRVNPEVIARNLFLEKDEVFMQKNLSATYNRLTDLQIFKFISITPIPIDDSSHHKLNFYIKLSPLKKYDLVLEPQAISSDQSNTLGQLAAYRNFGLAASAQFSNKNIFHGAEILSLRLRTAIEAQGGSSINNSQFFNSNEYSLTASLSLPRLVFLRKFDRKLLQSSTKTIITNSIIYETNLQYKRAVFTTGLTYQINKKLYSYNFSPIEISYINTSFANAELEARSKTDILLQNIFANNLITDTRFGLTYSDKPLSKNGSYFYWRWDVLEVAGTSITILNELMGTQKDEKGHYRLFGVNYYQYAKTYMDARWNKVLDLNNSVHFRIAGGYALPYGNSPNFITYEKRFFTGGANSIRAFRPRSVGPGTFDTINQIDRSGEVKLELNLEYRFNIYKHLFEGALFTDAGNVWTAKDDGRNGAVFKYDGFIDQLAIGSGVGMRLNLNIFIFRLDAAVPIKDPRLASSQRWVLEKYKDFGIMWENTILNFGVGYPF